LGKFDSCDDISQYFGIATTTIAVLATPPSAVKQRTIIAIHHRRLIVGSGRVMALTALIRLGAQQEHVVASEVNND
jgi:hypothetical protein